MGRRWQKTDTAREREIRENNVRVLAELAKSKARCDVCGTLFDYTGNCRKCGDVGE